MFNSKIQLPLFEDKTMLPTGKWHISYSEIANWMDCSHMHKLKHVMKIGTDGPSIHTEFGQVIHHAMERYVLTGATPPIEECIEEFKTRLSKLLFTEKEVKSEDAQEFIDAMPGILEQTPKWLDEEFPGWKLVSAEEKLFEPIEGQTNKRFKGFIDLVIKVPKRKRGKKNRLSGIKGDIIPGQFVYYILDWKTTNWGWRTEQKRSFQKQMQIILYKHFWCTKHGIDIKDARCGFVLLRRRPAKDGNRICFLKISAGPKAVQKALENMHDAINQIQAGRAVKNKWSCRFCPYKFTKFCP